MFHLPSNQLLSPAPASYVFRKMSVFAGHVDKHRGVVVRSTAEEQDPEEFGPKLASKFFCITIFFFSYLTFQGRHVRTLVLKLAGADLHSNRLATAAVLFIPILTTVDHRFSGPLQRPRRFSNASVSENRRRCRTCVRQTTVSCHCCSFMPTTTENRLNALYA